MDRHTTRLLTMSWRREPREILPVGLTCKKRLRTSAVADDSSSINDLDTETIATLPMLNAYKPSSMSYQSLVTRFARPLPYSESLIDMSDASQRTSPFLCAYYESIGKQPPKLPTRKKAATSTNDDDHDNEPQDVADEANDGHGPQTTELTATSLDQSRYATLTRQQHQRYLQWITNPPTARNDRNEYKKIRALVKEERQLYLKALTTFWVAHLDRLGAAVTKSLPFVKAFQRQLYQTVASYTPTRYGKCRQVISMSAADGAGKFASLTLETVVSRVLVTCSADDDDKSLPPPNLEALPSVPRAILSSSNVPKLTPLGRLRLLQNDAIALDLAQKHAVDILLPASVLQLLLGIMEQSTGQHDHDDDVPSLILGVTRRAADKNNNKLLVVDDLLYLSCASPRRALEYGHQEGMYRMFSSAEVDNDDGTNDELTHSPSYQYTLLEFSRLPKTPLRVLVRSQVRLLFQHRPVQLSARIKFFGDRGQHLATERDRACWLLNHLLQTMTVVGHVDPNTSQVVGWDEPSLAYALTVTTNEVIHQQLLTNQPSPLSADPMACFKACAHFLASLTTVGAGHHVVQIPAVADDSTMSTNNKALSASVHAANADGNLDILALQQEQLASTHESLLKPEALLQCFQYWEWTAEDRVTYTFPTETI